MKLYNPNKSNNRTHYLLSRTTPRKACNRRRLSCSLSNTPKKLPTSVNQEELTKLRQEAYADLQAQLEHYNHEFITRMRYEETMGSSFSSSSSASSSSSSSEGEEDSSIEELVDLFDSGTVKDYSQLIEWESFKNPPQYFECQGEYGNLF
ncbi:hypothetical protein BD770DRAFT_423779 [Pilaira anomala]|nr:hypothetical protein BD770DRAFT_423779 [Pilaira anomala]